MVFAAVFAGGIGSRMGNSDTPKQYLELGTKPVIIHTIEKFFINEKIDEIIVLCPKAWVAHTQDLIGKYLPSGKKISVIPGGATRNGTLENAIEFIENNYETDEKTVIVTHDAVRPFLTHRIIEENVEAALKYGACDTVIPATDTIVESENGKMISSIPDRSKMYQGQTPQSFRLKELERVLSSLSDDEKAILTDACKIFSIKNREVYMVSGEVFNIKITYPYDLKVAHTLLKGKDCND
ncbi:MAG: 2-C-methyl-D-erythritol 4-phosphate cytidylyltransferase [Clostridiaceae bacterium]|nr:2-C-methyl-D-erythritol 4-phosphate cytidylyltransferase [Clostridiaceae bacterium]MDO4494876.1 2-C-methyl-D-erythritol 4-phosphate cytidylyltransferase [Clostridiaceae bacterium]